MMTIQHIGFLIYDGVQPMDVIGPWEVFSAWKHFLNAPITLSLIAKDKQPIKGFGGISLCPHLSIEEATDLDVLVIPGGKGRAEAQKDEQLQSFIRHQDAIVDHMLSVCTGVFLLTSAGLLSGQQATTYWRAIPELVATTDVVLEEKRVINHGKYWIAGGVTSGIDLALDFITHIDGKKTGDQLRLVLEYFPEPVTADIEAARNALPPYNAHFKAATIPDYLK
jgi:transcriptional regulator GlxA family with amidase domain